MAHENVDDLEQYHGGRTEGKAMNGRRTKRFLLFGDQSGPTALVVAVFLTVFSGIAALPVDTGHLDVLLNGLRRMKRTLYTLYQRPYTAFH